MTTKHRMEELIALLLQRTKEGGLRWETTADENTFRLSSRTANVRITRYDKYNPGLEHEELVRTMSVVNDIGRVIEEYLPGSTPEVESFDDLYGEARRSASNTDLVLDRLMKELATGTS